MTDGRDGGDRTADGALTRGAGGFTWRGAATRDGGLTATLGGAGGRTATRGRFGFATLGGRGGAFGFAATRGRFGFATLGGRGGAFGFAATRGRFGFITLGGRGGAFGFAATRGRFGGATLGDFGGAAGRMTVGGATAARAARGFSFIPPGGRVTCDCGMWAGGVFRPPRRPPARPLRPSDLLVSGALGVGACWRNRAGRFILGPSLSSTERSTTTFGLPYMSV
ncbi:MAG: hypothetical protein QGG17_08540 [Rhodospirillales bacterium]|nr:hypothetical protein [Rhodospirillales bacterium]